MKSQEKHERFDRLPTSNPSATPGANVVGSWYRRSSARFFLRLVSLVLLFGCFRLDLFRYLFQTYDRVICIVFSSDPHCSSHSASVYPDPLRSATKPSSAICPQVPAYQLPLRNDSSGASISDVRLPGADELANLLSGAVQVDTSVGDDWPTVEEDPDRWEKVFGPFRTYLRSAFPLLHAEDSPINLEVVNSHGLLYTWTGKDASLKPILFMAHQDVVPVEPETVNQWSYPPFSGFIDHQDGLVWGRGSSDTKASLISILASLQALLKAGFEPERTIMCSFGFDEESAGTQGGEQLAKFIQKRHGVHGVAMIVDEGGEIMRADAPGLNLGIPVAAPAVAEKGYLDARITVQTAGGHSSEPADHTSIGYLAQLITAIEKKPFRPILGLDNPALGFLQCTRDAPNTDAKLRKALERLEQYQKKSQVTSGGKISRHWFGSGHKHRCDLAKVKKQVLGMLTRSQLFSFQTTQAVDLISGGVKVNALPEQATAVINHRIEISSSVNDIRRHIFDVVAPFAKKYELEMVAGDPGWEDVVSASRSDVKKNKKGAKRGKVVLSDAFSSALEPAPPTPLGDSRPWVLLQSVIRRTWDDILVAPDLMGGNTDTKSYWNVSQNIFRFSPGSDIPFPIKGEGENIHTVDERSTIHGLTKSANFFITLMQAASHEREL